MEADLDAWYLFEQSFGISRAQYFLCARENIVGSTAQKMTAQEQTGNSLESKNALDCVELWLKEKLSAYENTEKTRSPHSAAADHRTTGVHGTFVLCQ